MGVLGFIWLTSDEQLARLLDGADDLKRVCYGAYEVGGHRLLDLGKAWGALHFLLTGTEYEGQPPLNFIFCGGRYVGRDAGDSAITNVRAFASEFLSEIDAAFDSLDLGDAVPPHRLEELSHVRRHVRLGVKHHLGMLVWLE